MHVADKMSVDLCDVDRWVHEPTGESDLFRRCEGNVRGQLEVPSLKTKRMTASQPQAPRRSSDLESKAGMLRRHAAADVGREYGARTRPTQDVDVIGSFTGAELCVLRLPIPFNNLEGLVLLESSILRSNAYRRHERSIISLIGQSPAEMIMAPSIACKGLTPFRSR